MTSRQVDAGVTRCGEGGVDAAVSVLFQPTTGRSGPAGSASGWPSAAGAGHSCRGEGLRGSGQWDGDIVAPMRSNCAARPVATARRVSAWLAAVSRVGESAASARLDAEAIGPQSVKTRGEIITVVTPVFAASAQ